MPRADDLSLTARIANYVPILTGASSSGDQSASAMNLALKKEFYAVNAYSVQTLNTPALRTLLAPHHSFHENHFSGLFLCSDALAGDGFECIQQGADQRIGTVNVLEWIETTNRSSRSCTTNRPRSRGMCSRTPASALSTSSSGITGDDDSTRARSRTITSRWSSKWSTGHVHEGIFGGI